MHTRPPHLEHAAASAERFHEDVVTEVARLVASNDVVVVGMAWNPHVGRAKKALSAAGRSFAEHDIGSYASGWKQRLAVKMWAGWPTFPMVFVKGALLGGADQLEASLESGELDDLLA